MGTPLTTYADSENPDRTFICHLQISSNIFDLCRNPVSQIEGDGVLTRTLLVNEYE